MEGPNPLAEKYRASAATPFSVVQSDQMSAAIFLKGIAYEMNLRDAVASA